MLFNSYSFIFLFLPVALLGFYALRAGLGYRAAIWFLGAASLTFYFAGAPTHLWLILASIAFNFLASTWISRSAGGGRLALLWLAIAANLATLGYFKYFDFFATTAAQFLGAGVPALRIVLPIGISFYTFTQIAFLVDVYRRTVFETSFASYVLFVSFFPHLIAGPILHHKEMMPQFVRSRHRDPWQNLTVGAAMFAIGLFKKTVIADTISLAANAVFDQAQVGGAVTLIPVWVGVLSYGLQIYFDFSGYSDMAIGLGRMFGIDLPINFDSPYKSVSIMEFWRRWHITLSRFLRDYLYIPLGGNRRGDARRYLNVFVTMVLGGLWHGAGWTYLAWGALHGVYLAINHLWRDVGRRHGLPALPRPIAAVLTFFSVMVAWVPFRAGDMATALRMWRGMFGLSGIALPDWLPGIVGAIGIPLAKQPAIGAALPVVALLFLWCWLAPNSQEVMLRARVGLTTRGYRLPAAPKGMARIVMWRPGPVAALAFGSLFGIALRAVSQSSDFIYFQF
jgi:alginate O-acetyltransferase complex protein AlgI